VLDLLARELGDRPHVIEDEREEPGVLLVYHRDQRGRKPFELALDRGEQEGADLQPGLGFHGELDQLEDPSGLVSKPARAGEPAGFTIARCSRSRGSSRFITSRSSSSSRSSYLRVSFLNSVS